jgi:hypothetical protein
LVLVLLDSSDRAVEFDNHSPKVVTAIQAWITEQRAVVKKKKLVIVEKVPTQPFFCVVCGVCGVCGVCVRRVLMSVRHRT